MNERNNNNILGNSFFDSTLKKSYKNIKYLGKDNKGSVGNKYFVRNLKEKYWLMSNKSNKRMFI